MNIVPAVTAEDTTAVVIMINVTIQMFLMHLKKRFSLGQQA